MFVWVTIFVLPTAYLKLSKLQTRSNRSCLTLTRCHVTWAVNEMGLYFYLSFPIPLVVEVVFERIHLPGSCDV